MKKHPRYIPAFHFRWLTLRYDPMMRRLFPEEKLKTALIAQARIQSGQNVLDMGCGTGTLTLQIKQTQPAGLLAPSLEAHPIRIMHEASRRLPLFIDFLEDQGEAFVTTDLAMRWATRCRAAQSAEWSKRLRFVRVCVPTLT